MQEMQNDALHNDECSWKERTKKTTSEAAFYEDVANSLTSGDSSKSSQS